MSIERARLAELCRAVAGARPYLAEPKGMDDWQTPRQLQATGAGDCEDAALGDLLAAALHAWPDEPRFLVVGTYSGNGHAWARIGDYWADPTFGGYGYVSDILWPHYRADWFYAHGADLKLGQAYVEERTSPSEGLRPPEGGKPA